MQRTEDIKRANMNTSIRENRENYNDSRKKNINRNQLNDNDNFIQIIKLRDVQTLNVNEIISGNLMTKNIYHYT